jgi:tetratricopeptide (TPR) repeat protein
MPVKDQNKPKTPISTTIIAPDGQPRAFHRINIEYFALYNNTQCGDLSKAITQGMKLGFLNTTKQRDSASQWRSSYNQAFKALCDQTTSDIIELNNKLPCSKLRGFSKSTDQIKEQLIQTPDDYLRHFHIAWLYLLKEDLKQADLHFNIAALQSQKDNPELSCYALRHLAEVRYRANRFPQALLAIKTAKALSPHYNAELHFEYVRILARANRTSESLKQLSLLINKSPNYESLASIEADLRSNPSFKRFFATLSQRHMQNILSELHHRWDNDPINLLDLDKELGAPNSLAAIKQKQINTIKDLPELLCCDESHSSELIHHQSRHFVLNALNVRNQCFIQDIEQHQYRASRVHKAGQWLIYSGVVAIMALALSHAISVIAGLFGHSLVVNGSVQGIVLASVAALIIVGMILLHFTPTKLKNLLKKKQQLEHLSSKLGLSVG